MSISLVPSDPTSSSTLKLTVYVDTTCAWCYVGERELQRAVAELKGVYPDVKCTIEYKPYIIDPSLPMDKSVDRRAHLRQKVGLQRAEVIEQMLLARGAEIGIHFKFSGGTRQSLLSHRLVKRALEVGGSEGQQAIISEICKKVFEEEGDVGCISMLSDCAAASGLMCKEQAIAFLTSDQLKIEVQNDIMDARRKGITGVPFTVIDDKYAVCGGQPAELYSQIFQKVLRNEIV